MIIIAQQRFSWTFQLRSWFVLTFFFALLLLAWRDMDRQREHTRHIARLVEARNVALRDWRVVKAGYDAGQITAAEEAEARTAYFSGRGLVERAIEEKEGNTAWRP
ncbi:MAG TPA: hypothetical protein VGG64_17530 [Pirellulales bacterium]|jgi:hypothetical protein